MNNTEVDIGIHVSFGRLIIFPFDVPRSENALDRMDILTILILPDHEHRILHLFVSF